jgi:hypothetical protein
MRFHRSLFNMLLVLILLTGPLVLVGCQHEPVQPGNTANGDDNGGDDDDDDDGDD